MNSTNKQQNATEDTLGTPSTTSTYLDIAGYTRLMEIIGFVTSYIALCVSLFIYKRYRCLKNTRTRIHCNLFSAMLLQITIRFIIYGEQVIVRLYQEDAGNPIIYGINNVKYLCEFLYISLEYAINSTSMWLFVEGLYLHQVTTGFLRGEIRFRYYHMIGWALPLTITVAWAVLSAIYYAQDEMQVQCWYGYKINKLYWILQAPRLGVILINFLFLVHVMRVLIVKLKHSTTSELVRVRKAVFAALVLLPLLGITNLLSMMERLATSYGILGFQIWSFVTHFLLSFQGFFIALIYCFLNEEVKKTVKRRFRNFNMGLRLDGGRRRQWAREHLESPQDSGRLSGGRFQPGCSDDTNSPMALQNMRYSPNSSVAVNKLSETKFGSEIITESFSGGRFQPVCSDDTNSPMALQNMRYSPNSSVAVNKLSETKFGSEIITESFSGGRFQPGCSDDTNSPMALQNMRYSPNSSVAVNKLSETKFGSEIITESAPEDMDMILKELRLSFDRRHDPKENFDWLYLPNRDESMRRLYRKQLEDADHAAASTSGRLHCDEVESIDTGLKN